MTVIPSPQVGPWSQWSPGLHEDLAGISHSPHLQARFTAEARRWTLGSHGQGLVTTGAWAHPAVTTPPCRLLKAPPRPILASPALHSGGSWTLGNLRKSSSEASPCSPFSESIGPGGSANCGPAPITPPGLLLNSPGAKNTLYILNIRECKQIKFCGM